MESKIKKIKYFTDQKKSLISSENKELYNKYLKSNIIKNRDVKETTFKTYENYFTQFLVYLAEEWDNVGLYDIEFMDNAIDIMEGFMVFCQEVLFNNKKVINTKISAVSTFYLWSLKRKLIDKHPFDKQLDRMKGAQDERIINHYFLDDDEIKIISETLQEMKDGYDIQDLIIWEVMLESANRIGAIDRLTLTSLDLENMVFTEIREKRGKIVEVSFSEVAKIAIEKWLEERKALDNLSINALLITKYGGTFKKMNKNTIQKRINKMGKILGLDDFHAHCIRKTSGNKIYNDTGDMTLASEWLNHADLGTTKKSYIKPQSKVDVRNKIKELKEKNSKKIK